MEKLSGPEIVDRAYCYAAEHLGDRQDAKAFALLFSHPPGYRRVLAMFISSAEIGNGGFEQFYGNGVGFMATSAIEGYEQIGAARLAQIIKSSLVVVLQSTISLPYPVNGFNAEDLLLPPRYLDGHLPLASSLEALDELYFSAQNSLPGDSVANESYPYGAIEFYYENFPEDFVEQ